MPSGAPSRSHHSGRGAETRRRVDPYNLWLHGSVLYLVAWCHLRRAIRTFSLARLRGVELTDDRFSPDPAYDFESYSRRHFRIMSEGRRARVRIWFAPEAALYVRERTWHPTQTVSDAEGGAIELAMEVDGLIEVASWVASFGPRARAVEPPELVDRVLGELRGALARYSAEGQAGGDANRPRQRQIPSPKWGSGFTARSAAHRKSSRGDLTQ